MNAAQHVNYMMALCRLTDRLNAAEHPHRGERLKRRAVALIEFDRRITGMG